MKLPTFKGGIHPPDHKSFSENKAIEDLTPDGEYLFPMSQHIGAPNVPVVKKGDRVLVGQTLGKSDAFVSSPIISSVSGTVKDIAMRSVISPVAMADTCVIVESDGEFERGSSLTPHKDWRSLDGKELLSIVRDAGLVGMGGATFPAHVKFAPPDPATIDHVIINGAECEPFLNCDNRLMIEDPAPIVGGLEILLAHFPNARGVIAIEDNKPNAIHSMEREVASRGVEKISVMPHTVKYPQGAEKMLIVSVTGREIPPGALPAAVGCLIVNIRTLYHLWKAVVEGVPVIERVVSVTGDAISEPKNLRVPLGVSVSKLIEACGGYRVDPAKILSGGPMMGLAMRTTDVPVVKGTSGITVLSPDLAKRFEETNCIRCGKCVSGCPMGLMPNFMSRSIRARDYEGFEKLGGMNCIECGCCSFICPARRYLVQDFRTGKAAVSEIKRKQQQKEKEKGDKK